MRCMQTISVITLMLAYSAGTASAVTSNAFANGGFETVTSPPLADGWLAAASGYTISNDARTGNNALQLASPQFNAAVALQNSVANGGQPDLIPGEIASFSFWAKGTAGATGNVLYSLRFLDSGGNIVLNTGNTFFQGDINTSAYTQIVAPDVVIPAGANAAFVEFSQSIGPIGTGPAGENFFPGQVLIDDVVLSSVPEPASAALFGLAGIGLIARRRRA